VLVVSSALLFIRGIRVKVFGLVSCKDVQSSRVSRPECPHMPTDRVVLKLCVHLLVNQKETAVQVTGRNQAIKIRLVSPVATCCRALHYIEISRSKPNNEIVFGYSKVNHLRSAVQVQHRQAFPQQSESDLL